MKPSASVGNFRHGWVSVPTNPRTCARHQLVFVGDIVAFSVKNLTCAARSDDRAQIWAFPCIREGGQTWSRGTYRARSFHHRKFVLEPQAKRVATALCTFFEHGGHPNRREHFFSWQQLRVFVGEEVPDLQRNKSFATVFTAGLETTYGCDTKVPDGRRKVCKLLRLIAG